MRATPPFAGTLAVALLATGAGAAGGPAGGGAQEAGRFRFVVVGHPRGPDNGVIPGRVDEMVEEIRSLEPDLVFLTGDLIYGDWEHEPARVELTRADYRALDAKLEGIGAPVHRVPGNHDIKDAAGRDLWIELYGQLQRTLDFQGSRFLLLNSNWMPEETGPATCPPRFIRGEQLDPNEVEFVRREMEAARDADHVFVMMHHMLWWYADSPWGVEVHPLLAAGPTRAVFAGDLGPWKFCHDRRDGIDYIQSSVEFTEVPQVMLRNREGSRLLSSQLDNYVLVTVDGPEVSYEVRTLGALSSGRHTPLAYREVHDFDHGTFRRRLADKLSTPERLLRGVLLAGAASAAGGVLLGLALGFLLGRRRARRGAR